MEELKKLIEKTLYDYYEAGQNHYTVAPKSDVEIIIEAINNSSQLEPPVMPNEVVAGGQCCKNCISYEMTKEEHLQNFCSQFCIRMDKLYGWDTTKDYCNKFSQREA